LRYLRFRGLCSADLDQAVPAFAHWRLARMPRCLSAEEVKRLIAACKGSTPRRLRDRAIILMLVRLGLRAGDVSQLRLSDIGLAVRHSARGREGAPRSTVASPSRRRRGGPSLSGVPASCAVFGSCLCPTHCSF
jgi:integrase